MHPWHIQHVDIDKQINKIKELASQANVLAIGECGLDRAIETPLDRQKEIFIKQIKLADEFGIPVIIHSVRTYLDLIELMKKTQSKVPWILHAYDGNLQTTNQLLQYNFHFSFGSRILKNEEKLNQSLKHIPLEKIFFETDESRSQIESIYTFAAEKLQITLNELKSCMLRNFKLIFNYGDVAGTDRPDVR